MKRIFVTGANGLLGRAVLDDLLDGPYQVHALVRRGSALVGYARADQVITVVGDMLDPDGFAAELDGCDAVIHLAAYHHAYSEGHRRVELMEWINVDGTMALIRAAEKAGVRRFVHVSSDGVMMQSKKPADEFSPLALKTKNELFASKLKTEQIIDDYLASSPNMEVVVARPSTILGPQDSRPTEAGRFVLHHMREQNEVVLPGYVIIIDSRDAAKALIAMLHTGASGERFNLSGDRYAFLNICERLQTVTGAPMPKPRPPYWGAWGVMAVRGLLGLEVPMRHWEITHMQKLVAHNNTKMRKVLGVEPRSIDDTLSDTVTWFKAHPVD